MITSAAFIAIMLVGVPIGLCLCLAGFVYIIASGNPVLFQSYPLQLFGGVDSYGLIAIPLFILIGEIMNGGGITRRIVDMAMAFVGSLKGGLAYVNILANMFISSILGSATAQVAIMAQIMVPEMEKKGYDKTFAAGLTAYGGMLGPIIPPSVMFVVYSVLAQVSVSDMLIAGIVPGVILTAMFCVVIALMGYVYNYPKADYQTPRQRVATILRTSPTLLIPIVIVGSILGGLANATEVRGRRRGGGGAGRKILDQGIRVLATAADDAARRHLLGHRAVPGRRRGRVLLGAHLRQGAAGDRRMDPDGGQGSRSASC